MEFKKAPSNRGLRPFDNFRLNFVNTIQKSPIKSGIKTQAGVWLGRHAGIQKSPIKSGIKTGNPRSPCSPRSNSKKPHQIGD